MLLAVETGVAPSVWAAEGARAITTALHFLDLRYEAMGGGS